MTVDFSHRYREKRPEIFYTQPEKIYTLDRRFSTQIPEIFYTLDRRKSTHEPEKIYTLKRGKR